ncbi:hypothetical protein FRB99_004568, partial [Tulasnella sp. 403]
MLNTLFNWWSPLPSEPDIPDPVKPASGDEPAPVVVHKFDFTAMGFSGYEERVAFVIDNLFTQADCDKLLSAAEGSAPWAVAAVNGGPGSDRSAVDTTYRNSSRIIYDNHELADWMLEKMKPHIAHILSAPGRKWDNYNGINLNKDG